MVVEVDGVGIADLVGHDHGAARLREVDADVLLKTEMSAGHGGVSGRYAAWRERAFEIAWILDVLGAA